MASDLTIVQAHREMKELNKKINISSLLSKIRIAKAIISVIIINGLYSPFRALAYVLATDLTFTLQQTEMKNHLTSLGLLCSQYAESPRRCRQAKWKVSLERFMER